MDIMPDFDLIDREYAYDGELGTLYSKAQTTFSVWSPTAQRAVLKLYLSAKANLPHSVTEMSRDKGIWEVTVPGDLYGMYYTYEFTFDSSTRETIDIYARSAGANGIRGMVVDLMRTNPAGWDSDRPVTLESYTDAVIYELHVRDFSSDKSANFRLRGKFGAFCENRVTNGFSDTVGLDYIASLGVTHIHLLPVFDSQTIDENDPEAGFNWGYDPLNYNIPEGSYTTDPNNGTDRVRQFKELIHAVHQKGMGVIMDVVYNHTFNTLESNFERTVPGYFYRQKEDGTLANGSGCGNETASERPMMRKFMIESVLYWIKEYHIDGFRFDLMGVHDIETMNEIRKAVNKVDPTICIYGEGWAAEAPQYPADSLAMKGNISHMPGIAVFSDELRDGLCGPVWEKDKGAFLAGVPGGEMSVKFGIVGAIKHPQVRCDSVNYSQKPWAEQPTQMVSYVSCHDGLCLVDRLKASMPGATPEQLVRLDKLAQTVVFTSQGIPFIYAGEEVMRDKQGIDTSYKSPDAINAIDWRRKTTNGDIFTYYKRLIDLRKSHPAFRMGNAEMVRKHLEFLPVEGQNLIAFRLKERANGDSWEDIIVAFNSRTTPARLEIPVGKYTVVCKDGVIDVRGLGTQTGPEVIVPGQSALIMYK